VMLQLYSGRECTVEGLLEGWEELAELQVL
jgi:hypothetical protein